MLSSKCSIMIDGKNFFDQPIVDNKVAYENMSRG